MAELALIFFTRHADEGRKKSHQSNYRLFETGYPVLFIAIIYPEYNILELKSHFGIIYV